MSHQWCSAAVLLVLFVTALNGDVVDKRKLSRLVVQLLNVYKPTYRVNGVPPMFAVAVSIPRNAQKDGYVFEQVTAADPPQNVRNAMDKCQVYTGTRVVAATLLKYPDFMKQCPNEPVTWDYVKNKCPNVKKWFDFNLCTNKEIKDLKREVDGLVQHGEYRVLQNFNTLVNRMNKGLRKTDLMLFYIFKSPCYTRCASNHPHFSILNSIRSINNWNSYALVFSGIFVPGHTADTPAQLEQNRRTALTNLGNAIGIENIYRCWDGHCTRCGGPGAVSNTCVNP